MKVLNLDFDKRKFLFEYILEEAVAREVCNNQRPLLEVASSDITIQPEDIRSASLRGGSDAYFELDKLIDGQSKLQLKGELPDLGRVWQDADIFRRIKPSVVNISEDAEQLLERAVSIAREEKETAGFGVVVDFDLLLAYVELYGDKDPLIQKYGITGNKLREAFGEPYAAGAKSGM